jgi:Tfp pilus assembly protein PilN
MIVGVNFLQVDRFSLNYKKMAMGLGGALLICLIFYLLQVGRQYYLVQQTKAVQAELTQLKKKREQIETSSNSLFKGSRAAAYQAIQKILQESINWGEVLKEVSRKLPSQVWLNGFRNYIKADGAGGPAINLTGYSYDIGSISLFVSLLEKSPSIRSVVLTDTTRASQGEKNLFQFSLEAEVVRK